MKKILLVLSLLVILGLPELSAQLINPGFETWTPDHLVSTARNPNSGDGSTGWWDFNGANDLLLGSSPVTVFQDSVNPAPFSGNYCAKIISDSMSTTTYSELAAYGFPYPRTNGIIISGYLLEDLADFQYKPGIPCSGKMNSFSFYYRYIPNGVDTCSCHIAMLHWNTAAHKSYIIGGGAWSNSNVVNSWTPVTVNILYDSASIPDTVVIQFSACALDTLNNPKRGDTMNIDETSATGIDNIAAEYDNVSLYPNPANDAINLSVSGKFTSSRVEVYAITGKLMDAYTMNNNHLAINTQMYTNGLYFYKLLDNTGIQLNVGKFSIIH
jgi:Secretion system C-terminal sorting domain